MLSNIIFRNTWVGTSRNARFRTGVRKPARLMRRAPSHISSSPNRPHNYLSQVPARRLLAQPLRFRNHADSAARSSVGDLLTSSNVDEMLHGAHVVLTSAERRIGDYCSTFARGSGGSGRRWCWHIYRSLRQARRRLEAEAAAEAVTTGHAGPACGEVEALEKLVRELEFVPVEDMCRVLAANERTLCALAAAGRSKAAAQNGGGGGGGSGGNRAWVDKAACARNVAGGGATTEGSDWEEQLSGGAEEEEEVEAAEKEGGSGSGTKSLAIVEGVDRQRAETVFKGLDRSGRGWLDRDDLLAGLQMMGEHLDPSDVEQICLELGSTGRTFCDIVEAERLVVPGSDAIFLRRLHHDRPEWWTELPPFLDTL
ncbi:hypothetical protein VOLCADRAFT_94698 [Volvox carteri f. nagariensis]|uniref:EF-hand domain-containing protein n=1 Tax=Volvox carteri f. nagariensis TaxID=3068 RepID=D8U5H9_VOLCA|nr:uncharacterized protein VOLCADRAFT_94698 [Volvox carteri f. nagariensis]EFJ45003.1 hypothetical protein VOLCADRAFT_94698 [Volvox carteri f. nagariensis]|eukprot:XP_002953974.1 hypothetical protein VOLCADRAFT_94698 [Volvox carteri f. nagariensis]